MFVLLLRIVIYSPDIEKYRIFKNLLRICNPMINIYRINIKILRQVKYRNRFSREKIVRLEVVSPDEIFHILPKQYSTLLALFWYH